MVPNRTPEAFHHLPSSSQNEHYHTIVCNTETNVSTELQILTLLYDDATFAV